jgi:putative phosphoribosyl transferase
VFVDRRDAGRQLARYLQQHLQLGANTLVVGLARGGLPVAAEVARALGAPLEVMVVRKLGTPGQPELAMGALAPGGVRVMNEALVRQLRIPDETIERIAQQEALELQRREAHYRQGRSAYAMQGKTVVLVDDGLATGASMRAAARAAKAQGAERVIVAVPVGAADSCRMLEREADEVVCLKKPEPFYAVGRFYQIFDQLSDEEVIALLAKA